MHAMGLRLTEEELRKLFDSYDIDGNGTIDKNEFAQMVKQYLGKSEDGAVDPAFYVARWHADTTSHSPASTVLQRWVRAALERTKHCKLSRCDSCPITRLCMLHRPDSETFRSAINIQKGLRGMRDRRIAKRLQIKADKDGRYTELNLTVEELMASIPLLCKVPTHLRHLLAKNVVYRSYFATDLVVLEGEPADSMFILIKGTAKVIRGKERKEVMRLKAGNFFGENALTEAGQTRHASVRALDTMTCLEIRSDIFQQCVRGGGPMINTGQGGPFLDRAGDAAKGNPGALLANATPPDGHFLRMSSSADCVVAAVKAASHVPEAPPMPGYLKAQNRQQSAGSARVASISREQDVHADEHVTEQGAFSRAASNHAQPNSRTASAGSRRDYMPRMRSADSDTEKVWQTDAPPKEVQYDMGSEQVRPLDLRSLAPAANMKYDDVQNLNPCPSARPALRNAPRRNAHETRQASAPDQDIVSKSARGVMSTREQQGKEQTDGAPQTLARSSSSPGREAPRPHTSDARARVPLFEFSSDFRVVREPPRLPRTRQAPGDSRPVRNGHATGEWPWALAAGGKTANGWIQEAKDNNVWAMANDMMAKQQGDSMAARGPQLTGSLEVEDRRPHSAWVETVSTRHGAGMPAVQRATPRGSTSSRAKLFYGHPKAVARDWARSGAPTAQPQFQRTSSAPGRRPTAFGRHRGFVVEQVDLRSCDLLKESQ